MRLVSLATSAALAAGFLAALPAGAPPAAAGTFAFGVDNRAIGYDESTGVAYVASHGDGKVYTMTSTGQTGSFAVTNPNLVAVDPTAHRAYITSDASNTIMFAEGGSVTGSIPTIAQSQIPSDIAVDTSTRMVYVTSTQTGSVIVFNPVSNQTTSFSLPGITAFSAVAVDASKGLIYLAGASALSIVKTSDNSLVDTVTLAADAQSLAVSATTHTVYAALKGDAKGIAVIDNLTVMATIAGTYNFRFDGLAVDTSTNTLYAGATNPVSSARTLAAISGATNQIVTSASMPGNVEGIVVDSVSNTVFVAPAATNTVMVKTAPALTDTAFTAATYGVAYSYTMIYKGDPLTGWTLAGSLPPGLTLDSTNNRITGTPTAVGSYTFTLNPTNGIVGFGSPQSVTLVVNLTPKLALPGSPTVAGIAVDDSKHVLYVADSAADQVHVMNGLTGALIDSVSVGPDPNAIAIDTDTHVVYVGSNYGSGNWLAIIRGPDSTVLRPATGYKRDAANIAVVPGIYDLSIDISTKKLYAAIRSQGALIIDTANNYSMQMAKPGSVDFLAVAVDSATHAAYYADWTSGRVAAMQSDANGSPAFTFSGTIGGLSQGVAVDTQNSQVYTANFDGTSGLTRMSYGSFSGGGGGAINKMPIGPYSYGLTRDSGTSTIYLTEYIAGAISAISSGSGPNVVVGRLMIGGTPTSVRVDSLNHHLYAVLGNAVNHFTPPVISSAAPPGARTNRPFSHQVVASGLPTSTFTSTALPAGLTLTAAGRLTGIPTTDGNYSFTVTANNGVVGDTADASKTYSMTVGSAPTLTAQDAPISGTVNAPYAGYTYAATGTSPVTFAVSSGSLPTGLTLSTAGVLSGTPTAAGSFTYAVTASNAFSPGSTSNIRKIVIDETGSLKATVVDQQLTSTPTTNGAQTIAGALQLVVESTRSQGWTVTLKSGNLTHSIYNGGAAAPAIPVTSFQVTSVGAIVLTNGGQAVNAGTNIAVTGPQSANVGGSVVGPLGAPIIIARAAAGYGLGIYTITVNVSITVPAGVNIGLYTTKMITAIASRP